MKKKCSCCGKSYKWHQTLGMFIEKLFASFGIIAVLAFVLFAYKIGGFWNATSMIGGFVITTDAYATSSELRDYSLSVTGHCRGEDDCVIMEIYNNLSQSLDYAKPPYLMLLDPTETVRSGYGDCKAMSSTFVNMAINSGVQAWVSVSVKHKHAIALAYPEGESYYYLVDLTTPAIRRLDFGVDPWSLYGE